jgi:hypothetical protein
MVLNEMKPLKQTNKQTNKQTKGASERDSLFVMIVL